MTRSSGNHGHGVQARGVAPTYSHIPAKGRTTKRKTLPPVVVQRKRRIYVLDTNVLMHDPNALYAFKEHDVFIPFQVMRELDGHKKGMEEVSRNVRQATRLIWGIVGGKRPGAVRKGIPLKGTPGIPSGSTPQGNLFLESKVTEGDFPRYDLNPADPDDKIIMACVMLEHTYAKSKRAPEVVLVSKDINIRTRALMVGLLTEDYRTDTTVEDVDLLHSGVHVVGKDFWDRQGGALSVASSKGRTTYQLKRQTISDAVPNEIVSVRDTKKDVDLVVRAVDGGVVTADVLTDYRTKEVWGIKARNDEQSYALNLLLDPEIHFVSLLGSAGTGKTLLALAAGLEQVFESKRYKEIIVTRAPVPVGNDIGFLPGTETEKMAPWMGAILDNLEVLSEQHTPAGKRTVHMEPKNGKDDDWGNDTSKNYLMSRVKIRSPSLMRGRTFLNRFVILDEGQNLTPKHMQTLITRAGPGTKIVCLGNLKQIDTPYLTETSSGLGYVVERFRGWGHSGHITLKSIERSLLAEYAEQHL